MSGIGVPGCSCPRCGSLDLDVVSLPNPKPPPPSDFPFYTGWSRYVRVMRCASCNYNNAAYQRAVSEFHRLEKRARP